MPGWSTFSRQVAIGSLLHGLLQHLRQTCAAPRSGRGAGGAAGSRGCGRSTGRTPNRAGSAARSSTGRGRGRAGGRGPRSAAAFFCRRISCGCTGHLETARDLEQPASAPARTRSPTAACEIGSHTVRHGSLELVDGVSAGTQPSPRGAARRAPVPIEEGEEVLGEVVLIPGLSACP